MIFSSRPLAGSRATSRSVLLLSVFFLLLSSLPLSGSVNAAGLSWELSHPAKKTCKWVTKKVHGKRKRVRVCTTTPAPPPLSTTPNPASVTVQVDAGHAASATLGTTGGTVKATGADGTQYILTVPKNAVSDGTTITMTPISSLGSLPLQTPAAVRLQPEGLQFDVPATLEIDFAKAVGASRQFAFTSGGDGANWHLYPQSGDTHRAVMRVLHFSEYGAGTGSAATVITAAQHLPTSWQAQSEQLDAMLNASRQAQLAGAPDPYSPQQLIDQMASVVRAAYDQEVAPALQQLQTSDDYDTVSAAARTVLAWDRQVQLLGLDTDPDTRAEFGPRYAQHIELIGKAAARLLRKAEMECGTGPHQLVYDRQLGWFIDAAGAEKVLKMAHQVAVLGAQSDSLDTALSHCRPRGFKFDGLTLNWTWTGSQSQIKETHTISGHVCGGDPTSRPWSVHFHRVTGVDGVSVPDDNAADFSMTLDSSLVFQPPPEHNNPTDLGLIFGADFFGGSQATMMIGGDQNPHVLVTTHNLQSSYGAMTLNPVDNSATVPLQEDQSCPPLSP